MPSTPKTPALKSAPRRTPTGGVAQALNVDAVRYIWRTDSVVRAAMIDVGEADLTPDIAVQDATNSELDVPYLDAETTWPRIDTEIRRSTTSASAARSTMRSIVNR